MTPKLQAIIPGTAAPGGLKAPGPGGAALGRMADGAAKPGGPAAPDVGPGGPVISM